MEPAKFVHQDVRARDPAAREGVIFVHDVRAAPRKLIGGRVNLTTDSGVQQEGRMLDLSLGGLSATMEDPIKAGTLCLLDCAVLNHGKACKLSMIAKAVQGVFVSGKGYRIGFQFQKVSDGSVAIIQELMR